ncbi:TAXI family TRAP transporter solute-binding subunit [Bacillus tianshenii]|nr:TAXI family TRAP transporter solute-binding subunit [Bacillus tianshenii]
MNFKRKTLSLMGIMVLMLGILTACGESPASNKEAGGSAEAKNVYEAPQKFLRITSGPMGSGWYISTAGIMEAWMASFEDLNVSQIEGGGVGNLKIVNEGKDAQVGVSYSPELNEALTGTGAFEGDKKENIRIIASLYPAVNHVYTLAERDDINSIEDLLDKRLFLGPRESGGVISFWKVMEEYGITEETFKENGGELVYGSWSDGATQLKDGIVDAWFGASSLRSGNPAMTEIDVTKSVKIVPWDEEILKSLEEKENGIGQGYLEGGIFKEHPDKVKGFILDTVLFVSKDLEDEFVYHLTKSFWENQDLISKQVPERSKDFTLETALSNVNPEYLHPGAKKYYKEAGVIE